MRTNCGKDVDSVGKWSNGASPRQKEQQIGVADAQDACSCIAELSLAYQISRTCT
jgi:hypothetical protein